MTLDEYIQKLEAAQKVLPDMISVAAKNATIRAVEAAQEKTPPTADSLSGINTRTGELKQHWATDSKIIPEQQAGQYVTELNNNKEYASFVNDGHRMDKHFVPGLYGKAAQCCVCRQRPKRYAEIRPCARNGRPIQTGHCRV